MAIKKILIVFLIFSKSRSLFQQKFFSSPALIFHFLVEPADSNAVFTKCPTRLNTVVPVSVITRWKKGALWIHHSQPDHVFSLESFLYSQLFTLLFTEMNVVSAGKLHYKELKWL